MNAPFRSVTALEKARLRVEDFLLLDETGAFDAGRKTELIDGEVFYMNAQHRPHARIKAQLYDALRNALRAMGSPLTVLNEVTVSIPPHNAPDPDLVLTSEPDGDGPVPVSSVALIVEVSDTTLPIDLGPKRKVYAQSGINEYWVADVQGRVIHQMSRSDGEDFCDVHAVQFGQEIRSRSIEGLIITTIDLR